MTLSLTAKQYYQTPLAEVASYVRKLLNNDICYKGITEAPDGLHFSFTYQPSMPLVLSTDMSVDLELSAMGTLVTIRTRSQSFVVGDIFGSYDGYIEQLFKKLDRAIAKEHPAPSPPGRLQHKRSFTPDALLPEIAICVLLVVVAFFTQFNPFVLMFLGFAVGIVLLTGLMAVISSITQS